MVDREKVIKGLECCFNPHSEHSCLCRCADCPYNPPEEDDWNQQCQIELNMDALALLKEQDELLKHEYWRGYNNGRADERGLQEGTIMQTFSPD